MDTLFFWASKIFWAVLSPDTLILILVIAAWLSLLLGWMKLSRKLLTTVTSLLILVGFFPVGEWLLAPLENRFPQNNIPSRVDGIVVLGGSVSPLMSEVWGEPQLNGSSERLIGFLDLAIQNPNARLLFTGGSGSLLQTEQREADYVDEVVYQLGFVNHNIQFERASRNTYENALFSKERIGPVEGENWILVTSAFHMPRAVGVFCQQQWPVNPYPVDYYSRRGNLLRVEFGLDRNLGLLRMAIHEWAGLLAYRVTGKSSSVFPGASDCPTN